VHLKEHWLSGFTCKLSISQFPKKHFGLATRPHELGILSTRVSTPRGESVSIPCTHRLSLHGSGLRTSVARWVARVLGLQRGRSRNKVAVGEPAAGSPPRRHSQGTPRESNPPNIYPSHEEGVEGTNPFCCLRRARICRVRQDDGGKKAW